MKRMKRREVLFSRVWPVGGFNFEPNCLDLISQITKIMCFCFVIALNIHPVLFFLAAMYSFIYVFYLSLYLAAGKGNNNVKSQRMKK